MWSAHLAYRVEFDPETLKDLKKLDRPMQQRLVGFLKTLVGQLQQVRKCRVG